MEALNASLAERPAGSPRLVPIKLACRYGNFGRTKAYELIRDKEIVAVKLGAKTLIDLDTVDEFLKRLRILRLRSGKSTEDLEIA